MGDSRADDVLSAAEYERLARAAESYREELVVALCGEVGLRPVELARVRPGDLTRREYDATHDFLRVTSDGEERAAYVPPDVADALRKYAAAAGVADDDPLFDVTPRRLQMLVADVAERAADGDDRLADVSTRDLRAHFAHRLLGAGVDPRVVQATGGWSRLGSLEPYVEAPTEREVAAALGPDETDEAERDARASASEDAGADANPSASDPTAPGAGAAFEAASELGAALEDASTRTEVEERACEALEDAYGAAAVCDGRGDLRAWAGPDRSGARAAVADALRDVADFDDGGGGVRFVERGLDADAWEEATLAASALRSGDQVHGLLCAVSESPTAPSGLRRALVDAGRRVGWAVAATERKELLLSDTGVELVFEATTGSFFAEASRDLDCRLELEGLVPAADQSLLCFVAASAVSIEDLLERASASTAVSDVRLIRDAGERAQLEFVVGAPSPLVALVERGGAVESLTASEGVARVAGVFPGGHDVRGVVEHVTSAFDGVEFRAKREVARNPSGGDLHRTLEGELTEKQRSTLRAAYFSGYFQWPRGSTAEELADSMGVSAPTLHNHLRKAQQKVFAALFDASS